MTLADGRGSYLVAPDKTILQVLMVFALIVFDRGAAWLDVLVYLTVAVTVLSGVDYFFGVRRFYASRNSRSEV